MQLNLGLLVVPFFSLLYSIVSQVIIVEHLCLDHPISFNQRDEGLKRATWPQQTLEPSTCPFALAHYPLFGWLLQVRTHG